MGKMFRNQNHLQFPRPRHPPPHPHPHPQNPHWRPYRQDFASIARLRQRQMPRHHLSWSNQNVFSPRFNNSNGLCFGSSWRPRPPFQRQHHRVWDHPPFPVPNHFTRRMEDDVEEGEIRESESFSPLSDEESQGRREDLVQQNIRRRASHGLQDNSRGQPYRKKRRLERKAWRSRSNSGNSGGRGGQQGQGPWPAVEPPHRIRNQHIPRKNRGRNASVETTIGQRGDSNRRENVQPIGQRHSIEELSVTVPLSGGRKSRRRMVSTKRPSEDDGNNKNLVINPLCDSNQDKNAVIVFSDPPNSPDQEETEQDKEVNINPKVEVSEIEMEMDDDVEVVSVVDKASRSTELIVIDSTSSSDDETDFEDFNPDDSPMTVSISSPSTTPENEAILNSELFTATKASASTSTISVESKNDNEQEVKDGEQEDAVVPVPIVTNNADSEEDLEVLELRIKALEGLMKTLPSGDAMDPEENCNSTNVQSDLSPTAESPIKSESPLKPLKESSGSTVILTEDNDNEKENEQELELYLLREKLLKDLEKKKRKREAAEKSNRQQQRRISKDNSDTKTDRPSSSSSGHLTRPSSRRSIHEKPPFERHNSKNYSPQRRNSYTKQFSRQQSDNHQGARKISERRTSDRKKSFDADRNRDRDIARARRNSVNSRNKKTGAPNVSPNCEEETEPSKSALSLSVSVSKDGKHRTVVESPHGSPGLPVAPIVIEKTSNSPRVVRMFETAEAAITGIPSFSVNTASTCSAPLPSSAAQKPIVPQRRATSGVQKVLKPHDYSITRTVLNPIALKTKYQSINNFSANKFQQVPASAPRRKKVQERLIIPLTNDDDSSEEDDEEEKELKKKSAALPQEFHNSLDAFLKRMRASTSVNGVKNANSTSSGTETDPTTETTETASHSEDKIANESFSTISDEGKPSSPATIEKDNDSTSTQNEQSLGSTTLEQDHDSTSTQTEKSLGSATIEKESSESVIIEKTSSPVVPDEKSTDPAFEGKKSSPPVSRSTASHSNAKKPALPSANLGSKKQPLPNEEKVSPSEATEKKSSSPSTSTESLASQFMRTKEELQMREKLLRATFKKSELKIKLSKSEKEFLSCRQLATSMLGTAIEKIHQHSDKKIQCGRIEHQIEKLRKQLQIAEQSLKVKKIETNNLHEDAVASISKAFEKRSQTVSLGLQCKKVGVELTGEEYKIPTTGANELLVKFKEIYKLATNQDLTKKGNFKKMEDDIIQSFKELNKKELPNSSGNKRTDEVAEPLSLPPTAEPSRTGPPQKPEFRGCLTRHVNEVDYAAKRFKLPFQHILLNPVPSVDSCRFSHNATLLYWEKVPQPSDIEVKTDAVLCRFVTKSDCSVKECKLHHI